MNYIEVLNAIEEYEKMTTEEIQNKIVAIIKSNDKENLMRLLNCNINYLYYLCRKSHIRNNKKPDFTVYIKLMNLGINEEFFNKKKRKNITKEEWKERKKRRKKREKEYQHQYYINITKNKRAEQKGLMEVI